MLAPMTIWSSTFAALILCAATAAAAAPVAKDPPTHVSGVDVPAGPGPKLVSSYPADGSEIPAGTLVLKLTFDQKMTPDGWSYARTDAGEFPHCLAHPRLLGDQHTFVLLCNVAPHRAYAIAINAPRDFRNEIGRSATPTTFRFSTGDTGVWDMHRALEQAGLTEVDDPVMTWHDDGAGVSQYPPPDADAKPNP